MPRALVFSDLHNDVKTLRKLLETEADYYFAAGDLVSWARGLDQMAEAMQTRADRMYVIPGNHESENDIAAFCARHGFVNFHGGILEAAGLHIAGLGYSSPTPFDTPGEYSESELAARLAKFAGLQTLAQPLAMICHAPPYGTKLDRIKEGLHGGSRSVLEFIEKHQPAYFFCGHIHEAEGAVMNLGATRAQNVGKKGYLLEW
jgi:Icc-related predicted phosphoesterase